MLQVYPSSSAECEDTSLEYPGECKESWSLGELGDWFARTQMYGNHFYKSSQQVIDILCDGSNAYKAERNQNGEIVRECLRTDPSSPRDCTAEWRYEPKLLTYTKYSFESVEHQVLLSSIDGQPLFPGPPTGRVRVIETYYLDGVGHRVDYVVNLDQTYSIGSEFSADYYIDKFGTGGFVFDSEVQVPAYLFSRTADAEDHVMVSDCGKSEQFVKESFIQAIEKGAACFSKVDPALEKDYRAHVTRSSYSIACDISLHKKFGKAAMVSGVSMLLNTFSISNKIQIYFAPTIDSDSWESMLFHETLHPFFGTKNHQFPFDSDRIYACQFYCFDDIVYEKREDHCRTCFVMDEEDIRCASEEGPPGCLYYCGCSSGNGHYTELRSCLSACRYDLSCGSSVCEPAGPTCEGVP